MPVNYGGAEGLALAADAGGAGYVYESAPDAVYRAPQSQPLRRSPPTCSPIEIDERGDATRGYIDLDNSIGAYAGPPAPIAIGNLVAVSWGYRTASGLQSSRMADLWIAGVEHRRSGRCLDAAAARRGRVGAAAPQPAADADRAQRADTYLAILLRASSRAPGCSSRRPASRRARRRVTPKFTVAPGTSGFDAVRQALALLADRIRMRPLAAAPITRAAGLRRERLHLRRPTHPLRAVRVLRAEPPSVSEAQAFGAGAFGEAIDFATRGARHRHARAAARHHERDRRAAAAATAVAHLRQRALDARRRPHRRAAALRPGAARRHRLQRRR